MTKHGASLAASMGMLKAIEQYSPTDFDMLGITQTHFDKLSQSALWLRQDRPIVIRTLTTIIYGCLEVHQIPKITIPAEFIAPHIATLVAPANQMLMCIWLAQENGIGPGALELSARQEKQSVMDHLSADALFALVCLLADTDEASYARLRYEQVLGIRIEHAERLEQ